MEIARVHVRKDGVKLAIIRKNSKFKSGDYVKIIKIKEDKNDRS